MITRKELSYYSIDISSNIEELNWIILILSDSLTPPSRFNIIDFLLSPPGIVIMVGVAAGIIGVSIVIAKLKPKRRFKKERKKIEGLWD